MSAKRIDWETIEKDWRAGIKTKLQMSEEYGVSRAAMDKHFAKLGIDRDLTEKIRAKADALVTLQAVTDRLHATESEIVEVNANLQANIIRAHRASIGRNQALVLSLMDELEGLTGSKELFEQLGELLFAPDKNGVDKLNELYHKVIALPSRIDGTKKLAETMKVLIGLERQAFGIADNAEGDKSPAKDSEQLTQDTVRRFAFMLAQQASQNGA